MNHLLFGEIFNLVYEGEGGVPAPPPVEVTPTPAPTPVAVNPIPAATPVTPVDRTFSQDDVNKMMASEKRKQQDATNKALTELEALSRRAELTAVERDDLDKRVEQMRNDLLTKEELAKKTQERLVKEHTERLTTVSAERDTWKTRYESSTIDRALTDAAASNNAYSPSQIQAILSPNTRLIEVLEEGKPSGKLEPKVKFRDVDKDGKPILLEMTPAEAVKRMKEMESYLNLFKVEGSGGAGLQNRGSGHKPDIRELAKDPVAYRKARAEGRIF